MLADAAKKHEEERAGSDMIIEEIRNGREDFIAFKENASERDNLLLKYVDKLEK